MSAPARPARRGRRPAGEDARGLIVEAARAEFAQKGYDATSLRGVARAAGVDPALVHHYFEGKADLFAQAVILTRVNPAALVATVLEGDLETLGHRIVHTFLTVWDEPGNRERLVALLRSAQSNDDVAVLLRDFVGRELLGRITAHTGIGDARLRGALAASQLMGLASARYLLELPGVADASVDEVAHWVGPTLQRYVVDAKAQV